MPDLHEPQPAVGGDGCEPVADSMNIFQFRIYDKIKEKAKVEKRNLIYQQMVDLYEKQIAESGRRRGKSGSSGMT